MSESAYALVSLADVKDYIPVTGTTYDALLTQLIAAASFAIENYIQTTFVKRSFTEDYGVNEFMGQSVTTGPPLYAVLGGGVRIYLRHRPVVSITSITAPNGATVPSTDYELFKSKGYLEGNFYAPFDTNGRSAYWTIVYIAGKYDTTAAIVTDAGDYSVAQACKMTVSYWYSRRDPTPYISRKRVGDLEIDYTKPFDPTALPKEVFDMLSPLAGVSI